MLINNNDSNKISPAISTGIAAGGSLAGLGGGILYANTLGVPSVKKKHIKAAINSAKQLGMADGLSEKEIQELIVAPAEAAYKDKNYVSALKKTLRKVHGLNGLGIGTAAGLGGAAAYALHKSINNKKDTK